ncbi:hypothetical protein PQR25_30450 [Paraburkholderia nemoris]|uniref:hypothetical protein n=1 Tax=Paraburkholderia nemoris TaxID=2793076 RepID=UPI0038B70F1C
MEFFCATDGSRIKFSSEFEQLRIEHVLQRDKDVWVVVPKHPFLAIDAQRLYERAAKLDRFPVFSNGLLSQNISRKDLGARLLGSLIGGGVNAGLGPNSRAFVNGKANAKARILLNFNEPLFVGSTPWCAEGTHIIFVDGGDLFQHQIGELITVRAHSRPSSTHFDFTSVADLRDRYNAEYLNCPRDIQPDLRALSELIDQTFRQNAMSLAAAERLHAQISTGMVSIDYEAPMLTKYDRPTHDATGQPKIEVSFALLHYEQALTEFDSLKSQQSLEKLDEAFKHGVYCLVAVAACIEAIANRLVYLQSGAHPTHTDKRTPLKKLNESAAAMLAAEGRTYIPLQVGDARYDALDTVRMLRNSFMHAKELETDIDPLTSTSVVLTNVNEANCRNFLKQLRLAADHVFAQVSKVAAPIVTKENVTWMGALEVP